MAAPAPQHLVCMRKTTRVQVFNNGGAPELDRRRVGRGTEPGRREAPLEPLMADSMTLISISGTSPELRLELVVSEQGHEEGRNLRPGFARKR
ncbi:hypothetical protein GW17_00034710 [Ensete ventricosum]|nr:hypothetical protein GW17_00034710 [Ensete ventricosum]RZR94968.1 hypothetical protein BHM03_00023742 [Ensete ventricosum]